METRKRQREDADQNTAAGVALESLVQDPEWRCVYDKIGEVSPVVQKIWPLDANVDGHQLLRTCEVLKELLWEKLHTGAWMHVDDVWRDAYAGICLMYYWVRIYTLDMPADESSVVSLLDMGLLLGGEVFREKLHNAVDQAFPRAREHRCMLLKQMESDTYEGTPLDDFVLPMDPSLTDSSSGSLAHLCPVTNPECAVRVPIKECPSIEDFILHLFPKQEPFVLKNACDEWPAMTLWQRKSYWEAVAGKRTVPVEIGRHYMAEGWTQKLMSFSEFFDAMHKQSSKVHGNKEETCASDEANRVYLAQHALQSQIRLLREDILIPDYCVSTGTLHSLHTWIGPSGTITPIHTDPHHNILVQVVGFKYVRLYEPSCSEALYPETTGLATNTSTIDDIENVDNEEYPKFKQARYEECILGPGDALFVPLGWWHYVKSLTTSMSVSIWWDTDQDH